MLGLDWSQEIFRAMVDFLSVVSLSLLTGLLTFSAAVSFLTRCFTSAIILSAAGSTILALGDSHLNLIDQLVRLVKDKG